MEWQADLSEDRTILLIKAGDYTLSLDATEVETTMRVLAARRSLMEPQPPPIAPLPLTQEYMLTGLAVLPNANQQRIGLHIRTRELGWVLIAVPAVHGERLLNDIRTGLQGTTVLASLDWTNIPAQ
jgi:hypothetical protein